MPPVYNIMQISLWVPLACACGNWYAPLMEFGSRVTSASDGLAQPPRAHHLQQIQHTSIGVIHRDSGNENGNYYIIIGLYRVYIGIMEKRDGYHYIR